MEVEKTQEYEFYTENIVVYQIKKNQNKTKVSQIESENEPHKSGKCTFT